MRRTDLSLVDQISDGILPPSAGGIVVPDGVGVSDDPGVEVAHVYLYRCV